jgi:xyloglucan-specific endo-beta-1,4-glucanase
MKPASSRSSSALDIAGLETLNTKSNVAFDVFFDTDIKKAVNTTAPSYEIMVWIGKFGSILPIGATGNVDSSTLPKQKLGKETL